MATLYFLEYQKHTSSQWSAIAGGGMLTLGPGHSSGLSTTPGYDPQFNPLLHSTLPPPRTSIGVYMKGLAGQTSARESFISTQAPLTKQQLYTKETTWIPGYTGTQSRPDKSRYSFHAEIYTPLNSVP